MSQTNATQARPDVEDVTEEELNSIHGHEDRESIDVAGDDHALADMDTKRRAPIEHVAQNVVARYDTKEAFIREYVANAHTACIQAAKWMLRRDGIHDVSFNEPRSVLERAKAEFGYDPVIEVEYNQDPNANWTFRVSDNGIGIPSSIAPAIRDIGLSGWGDDGSTNGQFGQGTMSGFLPVSNYGEFHMTSYARQTDENYQIAWLLTDMDPLGGTRDGYGTTFEWPVWTDEAHDEIDVYDALERYTDAMLVPVIYREYDESGSETHRSDDFVPTQIEDRYDDDAPILSYEDSFGQVVWSTRNPQGIGSGIKTWCGFQPIDRNDSGYGVNSYSMPSGFDARVKVEDGSIIEVDGRMDHEFVGRVPVSDKKYENVDEDRRESMVPRSKIDDDMHVVRAPEPTDDRDRFERNVIDEYLGRYAERLERIFKWEVAELLADLDGLDSLPNLSDRDRELLLSGIDNYLTVYKKNDPDRMQQEVYDEFGVEIEKYLAGNIGLIKKEFGSNLDEEFIEAIGKVRSMSTDDEFEDMMSHVTNDVSLAPRDRRNVSKASNRKNRTVYQIENMSGTDGTVFMAKTVSDRKANLAWELHEDNVVVQVDSYSTYEDSFDWKKLKELPNRNFRDHFEDHDFDDDFIDEWDPGRSGSGSSSGSTQQTLKGSYDDDRAKRRKVSVRTGTGRSNMTRVRGENVVEQLSDNDSSDEIKISYGSHIDTLILYKQTEGHSASTGQSIASSSWGLGYAVVPNYVYDYLIQADRAMPIEEYQDYLTNQTVEFDWTSSDMRQQDRIGGLDEGDVLLRMKESHWDRFEEYGLVDTLRSAIADELDIESVETISRWSPGQYDPLFHRRSDLGLTNGPSIVRASGRVGRNYSGEVDTDIDVSSMFFDCLVPDLDRDASEWTTMRPKIHSDRELLDALVALQDAGGFASTDDDESIFDEYDDVVTHLMSDSRLKPDRVYMARTLDRMQDALDAQQIEDMLDTVSDPNGATGDD